MHLLTLRTVFYVLLYISLVFSGHIRFIDYHQDFANIGKAKTFQFTFTLDNQLSPLGFIRVTLPFSIDSSGSMEAYWMNLSSASNNCISQYLNQLTTKKPASIRRSTILSDAALNVYWIQFLKADMATVETLYSGQYYTLILQAGNPILGPSITSGNPVEIQTTSSDTPNFIIYDENQVFVTIGFEPAAVASISMLSTATPLITQLPVSAIQMISINLDTTQLSSSSISDARRIVIELESNRFTINDGLTQPYPNNFTCNSTVLITPDNYTCHLLQQDILVIDLQPGALNQPFGYTNIDFQFYVATPSVVESTQLSVHLLRQYSSEILTYQSLAIATAPFQWLNQKLKIGWGLELSSSNMVANASNTNNVFKIYKSGSTATGPIIYNTIRFEFSPSSNLQSTMKHRLSLKIANSGYSSADFALLPNSLSHNLPSFQAPHNSELVEIDLATDFTKITFSNVQALLAANLYFISFRIAFFASAPASLPIEFGLLSIYPQELGSSSYYAISSVQENRPILPTAANVIFTQNLDRLTSPNYQGATTINGGGVITESGIQYYKANAGVFPQQDLQLSLNLNAGDFAPGFTTTSGIDVWTAGSVITPTNGYAYTFGDCFSGYTVDPYTAAVSLCKVSHESVGTETSLNMRFGINNATLATDLWTYGTPVTFGFKKIKVVRFSALGSTSTMDATLDFYIGCIAQNIDSSSASTANPPSLLSEAFTYSSSFMFNSYVLTQTQDFQNINLALSNFWTGSTVSGVSLNGNEFPAFIRITGYLSASEKVATANLLVFFDQLTTYDSELSTGMTQSQILQQYSLLGTLAACSSSVTTATCRTNHGQTSTSHVQYWPFLQHVTATVDFSSVGSSAQMQIIIPVATLPGKRKITLRLAGVDNNGDVLFMSGQNIFDMTPVLPMYSSLEFYNSQGFPDLQGFNYTLGRDPSSSSYYEKTGSIGKARLYVYHTDATTPISAFSPTIGGLGGAAYSYVTHWKFFASPSFAVNVSGSAPIINSNSQSSCITFSYKLSNNSPRYGIFCPLIASPGTKDDSFINLHNFTFPSAAGVRIPDGSFSCLSTQSGILVKYQRDSSDQDALNDASVSSIRLAPNLLTVQPGNAISQDLPFSQQSLRISHTFSTTNELPQSFILRISCFSRTSQQCRLNYYVNEQKLPTLYYITTNITTGLDIAQEVTLDKPKCLQTYKNGQIYLYYTLGGMQTKLSQGKYKAVLNGVSILVNPVTRQYFVLETLTQQESVIDSSAETESEVYYDFTEEGVASIQLKEPTFSLPYLHSGSRAALGFWISLNGRGINEDEKIVVDLDVLNEDNADLNRFLCIIKKTVNNQLVFADEWLACQLNSNFRRLELIPRSDIFPTLVGASHIASPLQFYVQILEIRVPTTKVKQHYLVSIYLMNSLDDIILQQKDVSLPIPPTLTSSQIVSIATISVVMDHTQLILQSKQFNTIGSLCNLEIQIKPKIAQLNVASIILVQFPSYYPPQLSTEISPFCAVNQVFTRCEVDNRIPRALLIRDIPFSLPLDKSFLLQISGIPVPANTLGTIGTFFVALIQEAQNSVQSSSTQSLQTIPLLEKFTEFGEFKDIVPSTPPDAITTGLQLIRFTRSSNYWIVNNDYTFELFTRAPTPGNAILLIEFPKDWVDKNQFASVSSLVCQLQQSFGGVTNNVTLSTSSSACLLQGHQLQVLMAEPSPLTAGSKLILQVINFRNPTTKECIHQGGFSFSIADSSNLNIIARGYYSTINLASDLVFQVKMDSDRLWKWQTVTRDPSKPLQSVDDGQDDSLVTDLSNLQLSIHRGTYSQRLRLSTANGKRVARDVTFFLRTNQNALTYFTLFPFSQVTIQTGQYYVELRVGVLRNVSAGTYPIYFVTSGDQQMYFYDQPPRLVVSVQSDPTIISIPHHNNNNNPPIFSNISIPIKGFSLPIYCDFDAAPPIDPIIIETRIKIFPNLQLDYGAVSDYKISTTKNGIRQFVFLKSDETPIVDDRLTDVEFFLRDQDLPYFKFAFPSAKIWLMENTTVGGIQPSGSSQQNSLSVAKFIQTQIVSITQTAAQIRVKTNVISTVYWFCYMQWPNTIEPFNNADFLTIKALVRKRLSYNSEDKSQNQVGRFSVTEPGNDSDFLINNLLSNQTYTLHLWVEDLMQNVGDHIVFTNLTTPSNSDFLFKVAISIPAVLKPQQISLLACLLCHTFQYPYSKIVYANEIQCNQELVNATVFSQIQAAQDSKEHVYHFYFYPFSNVNQVEASGVYYEVSDLKANNNLRINAFQNSISADLQLKGSVVPPISLFIYYGLVPLHLPIFTNTGNAAAISPYSVTLSGITLQHNGFIYGIMEKLNISIKGKVQYVEDPVFEQVRLGFNSSNGPAIASAFDIYVDQNSANGVTFIFEKLLPGSHYRIVLFASSEDPSQYKLVSKMETLECNTPPDGDPILIFSKITLIAMYIIALLFLFN